MKKPCSQRAFALQQALDQLDAAHQALSVGYVKQDGTRETNVHACMGYAHSAVERARDLLRRSTGVKA